MASKVEQEIGKTKPVEQRVSRVNGEIAVGEDLEFQRGWWKFETLAWTFFTLLIVLDLAGVFGRGPLAKARATASDGSVMVRYERIQRTKTPSVLRVEFPQSSIRDGQIVLFVSNSLQTQLGAQRVAPSPLRTVVGNDGLTYYFPATVAPASIEFASQPGGPGLRTLTLKAGDGAPLTLKIVVMP